MFKDLSRAVALLSLSFLLLACGQDAVSNNPEAVNGSVVIRDDQEGLLSYLSFGEGVEDVLWLLEDGGQLKAVIRCVPARCEVITTALQSDGEGETVTVESEEWFPVELKAQATTNTEGNLRGVSYSADSFLTEESLSGRLIRIENSDYFIAIISLRKKV
jgi:hypothetical protein